jgi:hypothetical protein
VENIYSKLIVQLVKKIFFFLWNPKTIYSARNHLPLDPFLGKLNPIYTLTSLVTKIHFDIIFLRIFHKQITYFVMLRSTRPSQFNSLFKKP